MSDSEKLAEAMVDFCDAVESAVVSLKRQIREAYKVEAKAKIPEDTFNVLNWQNEKGSTLGDYQVAYKNGNVLDKFSHCFSILRANNSVIGNRFHEKGYIHAYWIYPEKYADRIFRKKLKEASD